MPPIGLTIGPFDVARITEMIADGELTDALARTVITGVLAGEGTPDEVVAGRGLKIVSDDGALAEAIDKVIAAQPAIADKVRGGKLNAVGPLVGAVMKAMKGQADPGTVRKLLLERLGQ